MASIEGSVSTKGGRMDNMEGRLNSTLFTPQDCHASSSGYAQNTSATIPLITLQLMHNPPRPAQDPTTQITIYP